MNKIDEVLIKHKLLPGYLGFNYVKWILEKDEEIATLRITSLYEEIAKEFNTTGSRVERCIRHILSKSDLIGKVNKQKLALLQLEYRGEKDE